MLAALIIVFREVFEAGLIVGIVLAVTLIGYTDQPTEMQLVVYLAVIAITLIPMRLTAPERRSQAVAAS